MVEEKKVEEVKGEKVTNGEIFVAVPVIVKLGEIGFHVTDSIELRKLRQTLAPFQEVIDDVRNGLIRKHGQEALKGSGQLEIIGPNDSKGREMSKSYPKFLEELATLLNIEVVVDFKKIKLPSVVDDKPIPLSANDLDRIDKFIEVA